MTGCHIKPALTTLKNTHSRNIRRSWPWDQVSQRAEGQAWRPVGAAAAANVGSGGWALAGWQTQPRRVEQRFWSWSLFPCFFPQTLSFRLSALCGVLQQRLNLFVSVVSVVAGPMPGSPTVITVFTKWQDRVPELWIAHESINGLLTAGCVQAGYL